MNMQEGPQPVSQFESFNTTHSMNTYSHLKRVRSQLKTIFASQLFTFAVFPTVDDFVITSHSSVRSFIRAYSV